MGSIHMNEEKVLHLVGWVTPLAMLELKRTLADMERGQTIQVILEGQKLLHNIKKTVLHSPDLILGQMDLDGKIHLTIQKGPPREQMEAVLDFPTETGGKPV